MAKHDNQWVIFLPEQKLFLKHPRGEFTKDANEAYGYHYLIDCKKEAIEHPDWDPKEVPEVGRRSQYSEYML